ncbi:MAG TPA: NAD(P)H-binding protein [Gemmatimonadales bacterium]|nr:NAD(P)H-binding protein [Gemmatimonadales bacterium]
MRVVIFGATGMVGAGALLECLDDPRVASVLVVVRRPTGLTHPKLTEAVQADFFRYDELRPRFAQCDACFFCLGVSSAGMSEAEYHHLTYDLTLAAAQAMVAANPHMTFCYVSGQGTDSTERGRSMWARVKGQTENALLRLPFKAAYMLRPGLIQPLRGVRSRTRLYQAFYTAFGFLLPGLRRLAPGQITTTVNVGRALIRLAAEGYGSRIVLAADINRLAAA